MTDKINVNAQMTSFWSARTSQKSHDIIVLWLLIMAGLVAIMVVIGGITRLTGSGLSMVEWRPMMGTLPPLSEAEWIRVYTLYKQSPEYDKINYGLDMTGFKMIFFWEYLHRLWGRLLGVAFALPLAYFAMRQLIPLGFGRRLVLLLVLGAAQGVIGWWMVKSGLSQDARVSQYRLATHLGIALFIFSMLIWTALDLRDGRAQRPTSYGVGSLLMVVVTILAGALVAGMDAGLVYNEYPLMGDQLIPVEYGNEGWRDAFENPASAQFHHRWLAALTFIAVLILALGVRGMMQLRANLVLAAISVQFTLGIFTLLNGVPVWLGGLHQAGAIALLASVLWLLHGQGTRHSTGHGAGHSISQDVTNSVAGE